MAVFELGRLFSDYDVDITRSSWSGRRWSIAGDVVLSSAARADQGIAIREQIINMNGNVDEPFVVVQWSEDPTVDGFYWLVGIRCEGGQTHLTDGTLSWSAELDRISAKEYPPLESICSWQLLTNNRSVTSGSFAGVAVPQHAVPGGSWDYGQVSGTVSGTFAGLGAATASDGALIVATGVSVPATGIYGWSIAPSGYYVGACRVTTDYGAATDQLVLGRRSDASTDWVVSNGLVRFSIEASNANLRVEVWTGTVWNRTNSTDFRFILGPSTLQYETMTVMRNSPECVSVRLSYSITSGVRCYVDLTLLRGSYVVYGYMSVPATSAAWPTSFVMQIETTAGVASTAITGGFRATSADAAGYRYALMTGAPACTDTVASGETQTSAATTKLSFGITAGSSTTLVAANALEFFARRAETTRVVDR